MRGAKNTKEGTYAMWHLQKVLALRNLSSLYSWSSLHSLILCGEASPNYGKCMGLSSENNATNRDCTGGSSKSGTTNMVFFKVWPQSTPY